MTASRHECLPIDLVLDTVLKVEATVTRFYSTAAGTAADDEARGVFGKLGADMKNGTDSFRTVCASLKCGSETLARATQNDMQFLSVLAESAFYSRAGKPEELAAPDLHTPSLVHNGLQLERDLLLFYMKFYGVSCDAHRPVFSELVARGQRHITELNDIRRRLQTR